MNEEEPEDMRVRMRFAPPEEDQWLTMQQQRAQLPDLHKWRHRIRVLEHVLMDAHPDREHIKRVLASEAHLALEDAKALIRTKEITGAGTMLDFSWPPKNGVRVTLGRPSRAIPGMEVKHSDC